MQGTYARVDIERSEYDFSWKIQLDIWVESAVLIVLEAADILERCYHWPAISLSYLILLHSAICGGVTL